jgi:hypothetical protein
MLIALTYGLIGVPLDRLFGRLGGILNAFIDAARTPGRDRRAPC